MNTTSVTPITRGKSSADNSAVPAESQPESGPAMSMRLRTGGGGSATTMRIAKKIGRRKSRLVTEEKTRKKEGGVSK